ncbi:hypothetical protein [Calothrix sp. 336/3]|uniref:hypothetical protein n=1 Tax=Calothrix sp. 336/3 TaxID=1337936 RepID=UPI0004E2B5F7|nr:hypothetical protein [Calothrix sp. 336/3]AKG22547.1 hypothetical protein IJ00_15830 [Calothrix sp. 336/3]
MSAKLKVFILLIISLFATAVAGVYMNNRQPLAMISTTDEEHQGLSRAISTQETVINPERVHYQTIPLERIKSSLQGTDPAALALDAFDDNGVKPISRKVEVMYPQPNQALVTITQTQKAANVANATRYRVELTSFGRSLLASSPPMWQIVWVGSQKKCWQHNPRYSLTAANCH